MYGILELNEVENEIYPGNELVEEIKNHEMWEEIEKERIEKLIQDGDVVSIK